MPIYLSLADDAVATFLSGFDAYSLEVDAMAANQQAVRLARAVVQLHLGLEKALKFGLASIDPALVIVGIKPETLQSLHRQRIAGSLPSILAARSRTARVESHGAMHVLHILSGVASARLDPAEFKQVEPALEDLVRLRNQIVHLELFAERDEVLSTITRILAKAERLLALYAPAVLERLIAENDHLQTRLRAIEQDVDGAWAVLIDYLKEQGPLQLRMTIYVDHQPGSEALHVNIVPRHYMLSGLSAELIVPRSSASGLLSTDLPPTANRFVDLVRRSLGEAPNKLGFPMSRLMQPAIDGEGFVVLQDGRLVMTDGSVRLAVSLRERRRSFLAVNCLLRDWEITFKAGAAAGTVVGKLESIKPGAPSLQVDGVVWLNAEYNCGESEYYPLNSTVRNLIGTLTVSS